VSLRFTSESIAKVAGVFSLLIALTVSLIVNRVATMALMFTGLSREAAKFQARSAFSGCGYTTTEAETIVNHPVRRRIVMVLMLLGNIGIATVIATVIISISSAGNAGWRDQLLMLTSLTVGVFLLFLLASSRWVERQLNRLIAYALIRFTDLEVRDYNALLQLADGYAVSEMRVEAKHWLTMAPLRELRVADEGILVLGIHRENQGYVGIPSGEDLIQEGDTIIVYGRLENIRNLDRRRPGSSGNKQHIRQVRQQARESSESKQVDPNAASSSQRVGSQS
jgi:hypothetical protein